MYEEDCVNATNDEREKEGRKERKRNYIVDDPRAAIKRAKRGEAAA